MTDIQKIREALEKASKGEWEWWTSNSWKRLKTNFPGMPVTVLEPYVCSDGHPDISISKPDMHLIANAPTWLKELCDEVERLENNLIAQENLLLIANKEIIRMQSATPPSDPASAEPQAHSQRKRRD